MNKKNKIKTLNSFEHLGEVLIPIDAIQSSDEPNTVYLDPMTEEQRELQYGARVDPFEQTKRVSLIAKQNKRRY